MATELYPYSIAKAANGINITDNQGNIQYYPSPSFSLDSSSGIPTITFTSGSQKTSIPVSQITSIDGSLMSGWPASAVLTKVQSSAIGYLSISTGGMDAVQTPSVAGNFQGLNARACTRLTIVNDTGFTLDVMQSGSTESIPVFDKTSFTFTGITDAGSLAVRRSDRQTPQLKVKYRWEA